MKLLLPYRWCLFLCALSLTWAGFSTLQAAAPFRRYVATSDGGIYTVGDDNIISYYRHQPETAAPAWAQDVLADPGWNDTKVDHLIYSGNGVLYAANLKGELIFYQDLINLGNTHALTQASGVKVSLGNGWAAYRWLLGDGGGRIYAIEETGSLYFYQHSQLPNSTWPVGNGQLLSGGWQNYKKVIAGRDGIIYAITYSGDIYYYRDLARNGSVNWQFGGVGLFLGNGWNRFQHVFSSGNGNLYGVDESGGVYYYHVSVSGTGVVDWSGSNAATPINPGASVPPHLYKGVYSWPLSAAPGEGIDFKISLGGPTQITFSRLLGTPTRNGPQRLFKQEEVITTTIQPVFDLPARLGCGWETTYHLTIPANWESGTYLCQCYPVGASDEPSDRQAFEAPFVVNPNPAQRSRIACLANTNTWNAYNTLWGGSHYSNGRANLSSLRPLTDNVTERSGISLGEFHLGSGEMWVQYWFEHECLSPSKPPFIFGKGIRPDVYTDLDFHNGIDLRGYCALFISTHPEYWSDVMYQRLAQYQQSGGILLYLGGNGIYERVEYSPNQSRMIMNGGVDGPEGAGGAHTYESLFRTASGPTMNERDLLGVATAACGQDPAGAGYDVWLPAHPFLRNVMADGLGMIGGGVGIGLHTGARGLGQNGKAAGLETDNADGANSIPAGCSTGGVGAVIATAAPLPTRRVVLAKATALGGGDAEMCYYPLSSGGFVFSVGSITFGGMLVVDPPLQTLLRNVVKEALTPAPSILSFISPAAGEYTLRFHGRPGAVYQLEGTTNPNAWGGLELTAFTPTMDEFTYNRTGLGPRYFWRMKRVGF